MLKQAAKLHNRPNKTEAQQKTAAKKQQKTAAKKQKTAAKEKKPPKTPKPLNASLLEPHGPPPPPCPANSLPLKVRQKAASRQYKCGMPHIRRAAHPRDVDPRGRLRWSAARRQPNISSDERG